MRLLIISVCEDRFLRTVLFKGRMQKMVTISHSTLQKFSTRHYFLLSPISTHLLLFTSTPPLLFSRRVGSAGVGATTDSSGGGQHAARQQSTTTAGGRIRLPRRQWRAGGSLADGSSGRQRAGPAGGRAPPARIQWWRPSPAWIRRWHSHHSPILARIQRRQTDPPSPTVGVAVAAGADGGSGRLAAGVAGVNFFTILFCLDFYFCIQTT